MFLSLAVGLTFIGITMFTASYIMVTSLNTAAENQVFRIRRLFFKSVMRQDIGWYDTHQTSDFASRMTEYDLITKLPCTYVNLLFSSTRDLNKLQEGIGEKIGMFVLFMSTFVGSLINAFIHGWELTLVMLVVMPVSTI